MKHICVDHAMLLELGACTEALEIFDKTFTEPVLVTRKNLQIALQAGLSISWFTRRYLYEHGLVAAYHDYINKHGRLMDKYFDTPMLLETFHNREIKLCYRYLYPKNHEV